MNTPRREHPCRAGIGGFSYVEVMVAMLETVLARPYAVLDFAANRAASSAVVPVSSPRLAANPGLDPGPGYSDGNFQVFIYRFTGSAATAVDTGMLRIHVVAVGNPKLVADAVVSR